MYKKELLQSRERTAYRPPVAQILPLTTEGAIAVSNTEDIVQDPNPIGWN